MPKERIAVIVVHGMGNQYPMNTLSGFVDGIKAPGSILYSSPNRVTDEKETRRLSFDGVPYDFFEYYWAHFVEEPKFSAVIAWTLKLLFWKKPSARLVPHIWWVRVILVALIVGLGFLGKLIYDHWGTSLSHLLQFTVIGVSIFAILKIIWGAVSGSVVVMINDSLGDVIRYTVPSPNNIATRDKIRTNGIELIKNLHEAKTESGDFRYSKIVVVAHSLGTVVAYDIISSLFAQYHRRFGIIPHSRLTMDNNGTLLPGAIQKKLDRLRTYYLEKSIGNTFTIDQYQQLQKEIFEEFRTLGNEWRISNFITMGSPLTHADMILTPSKTAFAKKKAQREFPTSPPQYDPIDKHFGFNVAYPAKQDKSKTIRIRSLHHAAHFAATQWTNIYFTNDWIGGSLARELGPGIKDIEVKANGWWKRNLALASHTGYWELAQQRAISQLWKVFADIHSLYPAVHKKTRLLYLTESLLSMPAPFSFRCQQRFVYRLSPPAS